MSSEHPGSAQNQQKGNLGGAWDILSGAQGEYTDLGIARKFGGAAAAYSLRDIGAMNGPVVKVRRSQDTTPVNFSAGAIASGGLEEFAIGQPILDLYNNAAQFSSSTYYVAISTITIGNDSSQSISGKYVFSGGFDVNNSRLWSNAAGNHFWYLSSSTNLQIKILNTDGATIDTHDITLSSALKQNTLYTFSYTRDSNYDMSFSFTDEDGNSITGSKSNTQGSIKIQWLGFRLTGTVRDLNINNVASYVGAGIENSNWEDGIGSNDGSRNTTLVAYTGQGIDAFVDTWYDQSGNGKDAESAGTSNQPAIIKDGSLVGGLSFDGTDDFLQTTAQVLTGTQTGSNGIYAVVNVASGDSGYIAGSADDGTGVGQSIYASHASSKFILTEGLDATAADRDTINLTAGSDVLISACYNNNDPNTLQKNSSTTGYTDGGDPYTFTAGTKFTIGHRRRSLGVNSATNLNGTIKEIIAFDIDTTSDRADIQSEIQNHYDI